MLERKTWIDLGVRLWYSKSSVNACFMSWESDKLEASALLLSYVGDTGDTAFGSNYYAFAEVIWRNCFISIRG